MWFGRRERSGEALTGQLGIATGIGPRDANARRTEPSSGIDVCTPCDIRPRGSAAAGDPRVEDPGVGGGFSWRLRLGRYVGTYEIRTAEVDPLRTSISRLLVQYSFDPPGYWNTDQPCLLHRLLDIPTDGGAEFYPVHHRRSVTVSISCTHNTVLVRFAGFGPVGIPRAVLAPGSPRGVALPPHPGLVRWRGFTKHDRLSPISQLNEYQRGLWSGRCLPPVW